MLSYRVDVSSILEDLGASEEVQGSFPLRTLVVGDTAFQLAEPAAVSVTLTNTGTGVVANGTVAARTIATCSRCLEPFELEIESDVEGFFVHQGSRADVSEDQEAESILQDGTVDLAPALISAHTVEAPFAPLHDEDCAGLCPVCGCDLNTETCECHQSLPENHPFAALRGLLPDDTQER
jgi:uncharacterized protein